MSRQRGPFDWNLVESLAKLEATETFVAERLLAANNEEINASSIVAKVKTLQRRIRERFDCSYVQYREKNKEYRRIMLRGWQWKAAEQLNPTILIWLGKQYLGQTDKQQVELTKEDSKLEIVITKDDE